MSKHPKKVIGLQVESDRVVGRDRDSFLAVRRVGLRNQYPGGGLSEPYVCDFMVRAIGLDAVVVAVYHRGHRGPSGIEVLLRDGLRPPLVLARDDAPVPDRRDYLFFRELVAGVIEPGDRGEEGVRGRAAEEVLEEAGFEVSPADVQLLGGTFPTAGAMPEKFWLTSVEIADKSAQRELPGDGSPMEEGAATVWMDLDDAIDACVSGEIEDLKTEVTLRRLRDRLR